MAKKSKIAKNEQRVALVAKYATRRAELTAIIKDPNTSLQEKWEAQKKIAKMPRDASKIRVRNRCVMTGRARGFHRKFGLSRIALREQALLGNLPMIAGTDILKVNDNADLHTVTISGVETLKHFNDGLTTSIAGNQLAGFSNITGVSSGSIDTLNVIGTSGNMNGLIFDFIDVIKNIFAPGYML